MNIPNCITLVRLLAVAVLVPCIYQGSVAGYGIAVAIFIGALVSDFLDGHVARALHQESALGATLDALVDKILVYLALFSLLHLNIYNVAIVFLMFARDMIVDGLRNRAFELSGFFGANIWGKAKFTLQSLSILLALCFCITGGAQLAWSANISLLVALIVSLPGLAAIGSLFRGQTTTKPQAVPFGKLDDADNVRAMSEA